MAGQRIGAAVFRALVDDTLGRVAQGRGIQGDVHKTGPGDVDRGDSVDGGDFCCQHLCDLAGCLAEGLGQFHRDRGGPVAKFGFFGPLEGNLVGANRGIGRTDLLDDVFLGNLRDTCGERRGVHPHSLTAPHHQPDGWGVT